MKNDKYTNLDKKIDKYLNTKNLRPGPPARLVNRILQGKDEKLPEIIQKINYFSFSMPIQRDIPWNELSGVKISDYGSETSYFLEFLNNKLLVLKSGKDLPLYYFGALMCKCYDVKTPNFRLMEFSDPEFNIMLLNLERASHGDPSIHNKILFEVKEYPFVLLYEYIPSLSLFDIGTNRSEILFKERNFKSRELMIEIGKLLSLDILLNNSKRLPFVWLNNGNPNNVLFKVVLDLLPPNAEFKNPKIVELYLEDIYAIDTYPFILDPEDKVLLRNLGEYMNSLNEFFKLLCYEFKSVCIYGKELETFEFKSFDKLVSLFKNCTGYHFTPTNLFHIGMGMLIMINQIIEYDLEPIEAIIEHLHNAISKDWANTFRDMINNIKVDYFQHMIDFLRNIRDDNDQVFNWIDDTTFKVYDFDIKTNFPIILQEQDNIKFITDENENEEKEENELNTEENKEEEKEEEQPKDFFNYHEDDDKPFDNDVHNGIYDMYDLDNDDSIVMETVDRVYKTIEKQPPEPEPIPEVVLPNKPKVPEINYNFGDSYRKYTREELRDKIKRDLLYDDYIGLKQNNESEAKKLEDQINNIDPQFLENMKKERKDKEKKRNSGFSNQDNNNENEDDEEESEEEN